MDDSAGCVGLKFAQNGKIFAQDRVYNNGKILYNNKKLDKNGEKGRN
jgi:hypothetical protein